MDPKTQNRMIFNLRTLTKFEKYLREIHKCDCGKEKEVKIKEPQDANAKRTELGRDSE